MPARAHRFGSALLILAAAGGSLAVHVALVMHRANGLAGILVASPGGTRRPGSRCPRSADARFARALAVWFSCSFCSCRGGPMAVLSSLRGCPTRWPMRRSSRCSPPRSTRAREAVMTILARRSRGRSAGRKLCDTPVASPGHGAGFSWRSLLLRSCCCCSRRLTSGRCFINLCNLPLIARHVLH